MLTNLSIALAMSAATLTTMHQSKHCSTTKWANQARPVGVILLFGEPINKNQCRNFAMHQPSNCAQDLLSHLGTQGDSS
ncbi:MAG: hypothetical protein QF717_14340, partial [SAR202 cluster bacterium]|nr:hypothetical protein [SAR202 cluster bacterium]